VRLEILGLTGNEVERILKNPEGFLRSLTKYRGYKNLLWCMKAYGWLHDHYDGEGTTPEEYRDRARAFGKTMAKHFEAECQHSIYLHVLVNHTWRWMSRPGGIAPYAANGLEAVNRCLRLNKDHLSKRDPLKPDEPIQTDLNQLLQMCQRHNRDSSELAWQNRPKTKQTQCGACGTLGHNRRTCSDASLSSATAAQNGEEK